MSVRKLAILGFSVLVALGPAMLAAQNTVSYSVVTEQRLLNPEPHNWLMYRGNFSGWGYSPLEQITRQNVRDVIRKGLEEAKGNYKIVCKLFNIESADYKKFLNFLRKHDCQLPFKEFRQ